MNITVSRSRIMFGKASHQSRFDPLSLDDTSPQIAYKSASNGWSTNHTDDALTSDYFGGTFHSTFTDGDTMTINFNGTAVYVYGGKRQNHGTFSAQVDNGNTQYLLSYGNDVLQSVIYSQGGLSASTQHSLTLTNLPSRTSPPGNATLFWYLDIDYIVVTTAVTSKVYTMTYDDFSSAAQFSDGWTATPNYLTQYYNRTVHQTSTPGSWFTIPFNGSSVQVFGGVGLDHGNYSVSLDGVASRVLNGTSSALHANASLFTASNLTEGQHKLTLTNIGAGPHGNVLDIDWIQVNTTIAPTSINSTGTTNTTSTPSQSAAGGTSSGSSTSGSGSNVAAIAGGVVGGLAGLALILFALWFFWWRKRRNGRQTGFSRRVDLNGEPSETFDGQEVKPFPLSSEPATATGTVITTRSADRPSANISPVSARDADQTHAPFLSSVPPPPTSTTTSYMRGPDASQGYAEPFVPFTSPVGSDPAPSDTSRSAQAHRRTGSGSETWSSTATPYHPSRRAASNASPVNGASPPASTSRSLPKAPGVALPYTARPPTQCPTTPDRFPVMQQPSLQRMSVAGREQDAGPILPEIEHDEEELLPPDYHQATEPLPGQRPDDE